MVPREYLRKHLFAKSVGVGTIFVGVLLWSASYIQVAPSHRTFRRVYLTQPKGKMRHRVCHFGHFWLTLLGFGLLLGKLPRLGVFFT